MNRVVSLIVLLAIVMIFGSLFYLVVFRFFVPLFLAALFAMLFQPVHQWMVQRCRGSGRIAATFTTVLVMVIVLVPTVLVVYQGAHDAVGMVHGTDRIHFETKSFDRLIDQLNERFSLELDAKAIREQLATKINEWLAPIAG